MEEQGQLLHYTGWRQSTGRGTELTMGLLEACRLIDLVMDKYSSILVSSIIFWIKWKMGLSVDKMGRPLGG